MCHAWPGNLREYGSRGGAGGDPLPANVIERLDLATDFAPGAGPVQAARPPMLVTRGPDLSRPLADHLALCERDYLRPAGGDLGRGQPHRLAAGSTPKPLPQDDPHGLRKENFRRGGSGEEQS